MLNNIVPDVWATQKVHRTHDTLPEMYKILTRKTVRLPLPAFAPSEDASSPTSRTLETDCL